jgi:hypothetical protein
MNVIDLRGQEFAARGAEIRTMESQQAVSRRIENILSLR